MRTPRVWEYYFAIDIEVTLDLEAGHNPAISAIGRRGRGIEATGLGLVPRAFMIVSTSVKVTNVFVRGSIQKST